MNTDSYLARIGLARPSDTSPGTLGAIQTAHLTAVPYENIDILRGVPLSLDPEALFDKIVTRRRGGYCFELNGLLGQLLRALGFPVTEYFARFLRDEPPGVPMRRHRVLRVTASDGVDYICDAGVGGVCPLVPLPFRFHAQTRDANGLWRIVPDAVYGCVVEEYRHGAWRPYYAFTTEPQFPVDYEAANYWCQHAPESPFHTMPIVCVQTAEGGRRVIRGGEYREFGPAGVRVEPVEDLNALLGEKFGINP